MAIKQSYESEMQVLQAQMRWGQTPLTSCFFDGCIEKAHDLDPGNEIQHPFLRGHRVRQRRGLPGRDPRGGVREEAGDPRRSGRACAANFQGYERLRAKLQAAPKHGNDDPRLDDMIRLVERLRDEPMKEICRDPRDGSPFGNCTCGAQRRGEQGLWHARHP